MHEQVGVLDLSDASKPADDPVPLDLVHAIDTTAEVACDTAAGRPCMTGPPRWQALSEDARVLAQAIRDMLTALGRDTDGDRTAAALIGGMGVLVYAEWAVGEVRQVADDWAEPDPEDDAPDAGPWPCVICGQRPAVEHHVCPRAP